MIDVWTVVWGVAIYHGIVTAIRMLAALAAGVLYLFTDKRLKSLDAQIDKLRLQRKLKEQAQ